MISKPILRQTLKSNYKIWLIFTAILSVLSAVTISVYNPKMMSSIMEVMKDTPIAAFAGDRLDSMTSLIGMLSQQFYSMLGILLPMVFIIITANSLVATQVDRGSMAYVLSTPIKRSKVVRTQAFYLITSVFCMFLVVTIVGLSSVQIAHNGIFGKQYTEDVKAASTLLNKEKEEVSDNLRLILENQDALKAGAEARGIDEDVYTAYLNLVLSNNAYQAAADVLERDVEELKKDPAMIQSDEKALSAAAQAMGLTSAEYGVYLDTVLAQMNIPEAQAADIQNKMMTGLSAAAEVLDVDVADIDMGDIKKNEAAFTAAVDASQIPKEMFTSIINQQLAANEVTADKGLDFDIGAYLLLNLGCFLLMFAISSISFLFSCMFNLSKNSIALGAGIPIAFFIFQIMAQIGDSLEGFKYLSLNTLFDTNAITTGGDYIAGFCVLGALGAVLYFIGARIFKEKDLPL